jgi:integrase
VLLIEEVIAAYLREHALKLENAHSRKHLANTGARIVIWWAGKTWAQVVGRRCREYMEWRIKTQPKRNGQPVSDTTVRHELVTLQTALNWYKMEYAPLLVVPTVWRPNKTPPRDDYFLTRAQVAARIRVARRLGYDRIVRFLLIGVYTGTRADAIFSLRWVRSTHNGWIDLDAGIIHRKGTAERETKKRRNRCRIHKRLLRHLKHWREQDIAVGITHVIHYEGDRVKEMYHAWETIRDEAAAILRNAGHPEPLHPKDAPHVMRHTAATWMLGSRKHKVSLEQAAAYLGMTPDMLWKRYGHHHPEFQKDAAEWR